MLDVSVREHLVVVNIEGWVGIDLHEPHEPVLVYQDIKTKYLEAARVRVVSADEAVVSIFQVRFQGDHRLGCQLFNLPLDVADVTATRGQLFVDIRKQLLRRVVCSIHERGVRLFEFVRVLVEGVVGQVHEEVTQVHAVWFLVVLL